MCREGCIGTWRRTWRTGRLNGRISKTPSSTPHLCCNKQYSHNPSMASRFYTGFFLPCNTFYVHMPEDSPLPLLGIYPNDAPTYSKNTCSTMVITALFKIAGSWKQHVTEGMGNWGQPLECPRCQRCKRLLVPRWMTLAITCNKWGIQPVETSFSRQA